MTEAGSLYIRDNFEEIERNYATDYEQQQKSDLAFLSSCMKGGIAIRDRKQMIRVVPKCFTGTEAVDWMLNHTRVTGCKTRKEGELLGEQFLREGLIASAPTHYSFQDKSTCLYRFKEDELQNHLLNERILWPSPSKHRPPDVASTLLRRAIELYFHLLHHTTYLSSNGEFASQFSPRVLEFEHATAELQMIDVNDKLTHEEALTFWLNVYHLMELHQVIRTRCQDPAARIDGSDNSYFYNIAGVYYTMASIECWMLRAHTKLSSSFQHARKVKKKDFEGSFVLHKAVPEVSFLLNFGAKLCPPITIYQPESVHRQIQSIVSHFLEENITEKNGKDILISPLVYRYYKDFGSNRKEAVSFLCENYLPQHLSRALLRILESDSCKVKSMKGNWVFGLRFDKRLQKEVEERATSFATPLSRFSISDCSLTSSSRNALASP